MKAKPILWTAAALAAAALIHAGLRDRPVSVDFGIVSRGALTVTVDEDGETRIRDPYLISAPLAGRLLRIELEPGDEVRKDDSLAAIDPGEPGLLDARTAAEAGARVSAAEAAYQRTQSQLEVAKADLDQAQRNHQRNQGLFEQENIAIATLEDSAHALRVATGNLAAAQSTQEIARFDLEQARAALLHSQSLSAPGEPPAGRSFEIRSPIDGVVLRRFQESSTVVPIGERLLEIGNPHDLEVRIDVLSQDAVRIRPGQRVAIEQWGGDQPLTAWVRRVEPSAFTKVSALGVDEQRVWIYADFEEPVPMQQGTISDPTGSDRNPPPPLGDAYRVEARVVVWEQPDVIRVPGGALFRDGENWAVYRLSATGQAERVTVELGQRNDLEAEVKAGLAPGDRVVLHPGDQVRPGVALRERQT
ncbi:MAG: HlyD family efflux transporter periplasmic adaptor subunit [Verrucomicrobiales bacterium]|nr:HlyD family efflux transporter periplasmic adaptor subunit [Verrucomicrobiales bacterium]